MRNILFILFVGFILSNCKQSSVDELHAQNQVLDSNKVIEPLEFHPEINKMVTRILSRYHYKKMDLNDSLSSIVFDNYIKSLDYNRAYFLKSDIDDFEQYRFEFDENLYLGKLYPAYRIFNIYKNRMSERMKFVLKRLDTEFKFDTDETYLVDRENEPWLESSEELDELWRKKLKHEALNLKLTGKKWEDIQKTLSDR